MFDFDLRLKIADSEKVIRGNREILAKSNDIFDVGLSLSVFPMAVRNLSDSELVRNVALGNLHDFNLSCILFITPP